MFVAVVAHLIIAVLLPLANASDSNTTTTTITGQEIVKDYELTVDQRFERAVEMTSFKSLKDGLRKPRLERKEPYRAATANPYHPEGEESVVFGPAGMVPAQLALAPAMFQQFGTPWIRPLYTLAYMAYSVGLTLKNSYHRASWSMFTLTFGLMFVHVAALGRFGLSQPVFTCLERIGFDLISLRLLRMKDLAEGIPVHDSGKMELSTRAADKALMSTFLARSLVNVGMTIVPWLLSDLFVQLAAPAGRNAQLVAPVIAHLICAKLIVPYSLASFPQRSELDPLHHYDFSDAFSMEAYRPEEYSRGW